MADENINLIDLEYVTRNHVELTNDLNSHARDILDTLPVMVLPDGFRYESLDRFLPTKIHFEGYYRTYLIADFAQYCHTNNILTQSQVFVDSDSMTALRILDLGRPDAPGHARHQAMLKLKQTYAFEWFVNNLEGGKMKPYDQRELVNLLADWRDYITVKDGAGKTVPIKQAMVAIRSIKLDAVLEQTNEVSDFSQSSSSMERIEANSQSSRALPDHFVFRCVPYYGCKARDIEVQISMHFAQGQQPSLKLRAVGMDALREEIAQEFCDQLKTAFKGDNVLMGDFSVADFADYGRRR